MTTKKSIEREHLEQFQKLYSNFPKGIVTESERPDFIINSKDGKRIGIEHTRIYRDKEVNKQFTLKEKLVFEERVTNQIRKEYRKINSTPLQLSISYKELKLNNKERDRLAKKIAILINEEVSTKSTLENFNIEVEIDKLPTEIKCLSIWYFKGIIQTTWNFGDGVWIPQISKPKVQSIIDKKDEILKSYKRNFDKTILLIVEDDSAASWHDKYEKLETDYFNSGFNKIFILSCIWNKLVELKLTS